MAQYQPSGRADLSTVLAGILKEVGYYPTADISNKAKAAKGTEEQAPMTDKGDLQPNMLEFINAASYEARKGGGGEGPNYELHKAINDFNAKFKTIVT